MIEEWTDVYEAWQDPKWVTPWFNFTPEEFACSHCGRIRIDTEALDALQAARTAYGRPVQIFAAYRCPEHPLERNKPAGPGAHARGNAFDTGVSDLRDWIQCVIDAPRPPYGFGMGARNGSIHFHIDWDEKLGHRAWGY